MDTDSEKTKNLLNNFHIQPINDYTVLDDLHTFIERKHSFGIVERCTHYLCYLKEPARILIDRRAYKAITYLRKHARRRSEFESFTKNRELTEIIANVYLYYINELESFLNFYFNTTSARAKSEDIFQIYVQQFQSIRYLTVIIWTVSGYSKLFCENFNEFNGFKALISYLTNDNMVDQLLNLKDSINMKPLNGEYFIRSILGTLQNMIAISNHMLKGVNNYETSKILIKLVSHFAKNELLCTSTYMILAHLLNDEQIQNLPDAQQAIEHMIKILRIGADNLANKKNVERVQIDMLTEYERHYTDNVCQIFGTWNIIEVLDALYCLAVNDTTKTLLFDAHNIKEPLEKIIMNGNETEKSFAMKLLWQLSFDSKIARNLSTDKNMYPQLVNMSRMDSGEIREDLRLTSKGIVWLVSQLEENSKTQLLRSANRYKRRSANVRSATKKPLAASVDSLYTKPNHIMISYNSMNRDICLKIKRELERNGLTVWIDVERIHGSGLEAMAKAVEDSRCVLMCMTEKYKQSPNCRAEAEYAFKLGVPIIPLVMQRDYVPDGWLGIILGSKIYVDFSKYSFDESIKKLFNEIKSLDRVKSSVSTTKDTIKTQSTKNLQSSNSIDENLSQTATPNDNWTQDDVFKWLNEKQIDSQIVNILKNFNGRMLRRLNTVRLSAPDFFYKTISQDNKIDLLAVLIFTDEFERLFS